MPTSIPYASLFPYKKAVAKALLVRPSNNVCMYLLQLMLIHSQQLLEHKKRAVRRRAGVARNVWLCMST